MHQRPTGIWQLTPLEVLVVNSNGYRKANPIKVQKLENSLIAYGQLKPLVIRQNVVLDGRWLLQAMRNIGWVEAMTVEAPDGFIELALDIQHDVDYAALADFVGCTPASATDLANVANFSAERLDYFRQLLRFDWSQFKLEEDQQVLWEEETAHATRWVDQIGGDTERKSLVPEPIKRVTIKPSQQVIQRPPPPPLPELPPRQQLSPVVIIKPGAAPIAPKGPEPPTGQEVTPTDILVRFSGPPPPEIANWKPEEPPQLAGCDEIELDCETNGLRWFAGDRPIGISVRRPGDGHTWYLPFAHAGGNLDEEAVRRWAKQELKHKKIFGANIKFDNHMLYAWGVDLEEQGCTPGDVQHYAALLDDHRREYNLDALSRDFLGKHKTGQELDKQHMADYHAGVVAPYAMNDVSLTGELRTAMWPQLEQQELHRVRQIEEDVIYPVCEMERNAAPIDRDLLQEWDRRSSQELDALLTYVAETLGFQVNPDSHEDLSKMFHRLGLPIEHYTENGAPSFTDEILRGVDNEYVQLVRRAGKLASLRSKFISPYNDAVGDDWLLRFELHQLRGDEYGTVRGRFSASNKNIQQVAAPTKQRLAWGYAEDDTSHDDEIYLIRKLFIAANGKVLSADAAQIEYRIFAHYANSAKVIAAYTENPQISYHKIAQQMVEGLAKLGYDRIKTMNFMLIYGGGRDTTARVLGLPRLEADKFFDKYHHTFPEIRPLLSRSSKLAEERGFVRTVCGRRQRFPGGQFAHKAFNAVDQGSAADIMKIKLAEVHRERKRTGFVLRMTVHDEIVGDCPDDPCERMINEILNRQSVELRVPILWKTATGSNWAEC
jgi:DNA polymerase I-like protein with 3'-5' exonuclease and polymerase domains